jgi:arginase
MKVQVIQVPYDSGHRSLRMGGGPEHFITNGVTQVLQSAGHEVSLETIESQAEFRAETQTQFELYGLLSDRVAQAKRTGKFPLVLSGNCGATVGVIAGMGAQKPGVIWFDTHGEFNTPETTTSGFLDGMGLAVATGLCWKKLAASIPNFQPISGGNILLIGGRDFDPGERERAEQAGVAVLDAASIEQATIRDILSLALAKLQADIKEVHLHIDLDVLNPKETPANSFVTEEGGLSVEQLSEAIRLIKRNLKVTSATIASFDPNYDLHKKTLQASFKLIRQIISEA